MSLRTPEKVGEARVLVEPKWGKGMIEQDYRFPDGTVKDFNLWHSPAARTVIMFPFTEHGEVIALRQWRPAAAFSAPEECWITELPGGNARRGTNPTDGEIAGAELLEETGYHAQEWRRPHLQNIWWEPANLTPRYAPLIGIGCVKVAEPKPDETELIEVLVLPLGAWLDMIRSGKVCDAKSIVLTFLALPCLEGEIVFPARL